MTQDNTPAATRVCYLLAILCILVGFAVEIYAVLIGSWSVFSTGLAIFLFSLPCAAGGWYLRHRDNIRRTQ